MIFISKSATKTQNLAKKFAKKLKGGEIVLLSGNLGAGKTVFVKGLAKGLGVKELITSPSFVLLKDYGKLVHIDLYRLSKIKDIKALGLLEELGNPQKITVVEWAEKIKPFLKNLKAPQVWVEIKYVDKNTRRIMQSSKCKSQNDNCKM